MTEPVRLLLPSPPVLVLERLESAGFSAYVVGGCVRDGLRGRIPHDWDICTSARPEQMHAALAGFTVHDTGIKHGTVTAVVQKVPIEITSYRGESRYSDGRRPDSIRFLEDVEGDLARRDFTMNAMAWSPARGLCDPFGGQEDLKNNLLRCVGDADARFGEDALRILRGIRLKAQYGFAIAPETRQAMTRRLDKLTNISYERIYEELRRILCGRFCGRVLREDKEIIAAICPEFAPMFGLHQFKSSHKYDVWEHTVRAVEMVPPDPVLRLAMLFHDSGKPDTLVIDENGAGRCTGHQDVSAEIAQKVLRRLRAEQSTTQSVMRLAKQHDQPLGITQKNVRVRLSQTGIKDFRRLLAMQKADLVAKGTRAEKYRQLLKTERMLQRILENNECYSIRQLAVSGQDILGAGIAGKEVGRMLRYLLRHVLQCPDDNKKDTLLALAQARRKEAKI